MGAKLLCTVALLAMAAPAAAALTITSLRTENQTTPINLDTTAPRFSWMLESGERGQRQTAYEILVATARELLQPGHADLWDSGRVAGDASHLVEYRGKTLHSDQTVYWTVRVWDTHDDASAPPAPASFTTALLYPADWRAKWITNGGDPTITSVPIQLASWIWAPKPAPKPGKLPQIPVGATCTFTRTVQLPTSEITAAILTAAADNQGEVLVNGASLGEIADWEQARQIPIAKQLHAGAANTITIRVTNGGDRPNPAGLLALISLQCADGTTTHVPTDSNWMTELPASNDTSQTITAPARILGPWGMKPWEHSTVSTPPPPRPIFRKQFAVKRPFRRALIHICGLGQHKLYVNGQSASDDFLDPAWAEYPKTDFYNTYDISSKLHQGDNALGVMLANGFYNTAGDRRVNGNHVKRQLSLIAQLQIDYADGTSETIATDESWQWRTGPYTHTSIHGGVDYDARLLPANWATPQADAEGWNSSLRDTTPHGKLTAQMSPPLKVFQRFQPASISEPAPGHFLYDFGQNASSAISIRAKGPAGARIRFTYSEQRQGSTPSRNDGKGLADQSGIRSPNYMEYTLRGGDEERWFSDLFYSGFQYIEVEGAVPAGRPNPGNKPVLLELTSDHIHADCPAVGTFACSDPMYERIDRMVDWSVRSNLSHVLTDCPHREKMGWLEVIHLMWPSIASRYDLSRFGEKVARDIRDSQQPDGKIFTVAPAYPDGFPGPFQYTPEWGASGVLIPWYTYAWYGDRRVLEQNYDCMHRFVDYMTSTAKDYIPEAGLGDWYDYGHGQELGASRFTPTDLTATCIYADCAHRVAQAAQVLGRDADQQKYEELHAKIRDAFNRHFHVAPGEYKNNGSPQTGNAMALVTGMVPVDEQNAAIDKIVADMKNRSWLQTAGDVGFHYLVRALADWGHSDAIFSMLSRTELGSYQYLVNAGWTSLPESWNAYRHYSMNHCMLGHIQEWFSEDLVGIAPDESDTSTSVGFRHFHLRPTVDGPITSASGNLRTPYGEIRCSWKRDNNKLTIQATVPVGTKADLRLPKATELSQVLESGKPVLGQPGIKAADTGSELHLTPGTYKFELPMK